MMEAVEQKEQHKTSENGGKAKSASPIGKIILVASMAAAIQFGWALQLSLLTPYVQLLGVPHMWAAFIWLCGPLSGLLVQPIIGYYSDRCHSRFGRRRPFIVTGTTLVSIAVFLIGFAADIGSLAGDTFAASVVKPRAVTVFIVGFWILDIGNNILQGPGRALLADLSAGDHRLTRIANAAFSFFMAVGNILGYAAGSYRNLHTILPFAMTSACGIYCANLKTCFVISILLLLLVTILVVSMVQEEPRDDPRGGTGRNKPFIGEVMAAFRTLSRAMWMLMLVTGMNWVAWFPFILYDTDWMGKEVYGGEANGNAREAKAALYHGGVRAGSLGLMLNAISLALMSVGVEPAVRVVGVKRLWGGVNFVLAVCLAMTVWVTRAAEAARRARGEDYPPPGDVKASALTLFAVLGIPQAVTFSIPFALASIFSSISSGGQGLSLGVLNLAIVIPQMLVSVVSGPLDALFGGGNLPAFVMGAIAAAVSGLLALTILPLPSQEP